VYGDIVAKKNEDEEEKDGDEEEDVDGENVGKKRLRS
jgi:hypothetical protein